LQGHNDNIKLLKCEKGVKTLHTMKRNKDNAMREMRNEEMMKIQKKTANPNDLNNLHTQNHLHCQPHFHTKNEHHAMDFWQK
jgi:hypothetical protein